MNEAVFRIEQVAKALGDLCNEVTFLGGAVLPLLITDPAAGPVRPTKDVDVIVEAMSYGQYARFEAHLRAQGWQNVPDVICR